MPKTLLKGDGSDVRGMLLDGGLLVASTRKAREQLTFYLVSKRSELRALAVSATGWDGNTFVLPDGAIGEGIEKPFLQTEYAFDHKYNVKGSLAEWKTNIAAKPLLR